MSPGRACVRAGGRQTAGQMGACTGNPPVPAPTTHRGKDAPNGRRPAIDRIIAARQSAGTRDEYIHPVCVNRPNSTGHVMFTSLSVFCPSLYVFAGQLRSAIRLEFERAATILRPMLRPYGIAEIRLLSLASCGSVYCNRSCLLVCVWVCYHDNSKLCASILTKLGL